MTGVCVRQSVCHVDEPCEQEALDEDVPVVFLSSLQCLCHFSRLVLLSPYLKGGVSQPQALSDLKAWSEPQVLSCLQVWCELQVLSELQAFSLLLCLSKLQVV